jgi:hypothetical protein
MSYILPQHPMLKIMADALIQDTIDTPEVMEFLPVHLWDFLITQTWRDGVNDEYVSQASPR